MLLVFVFYSQSTCGDFLKIKTYKGCEFKESKKCYEGKEFSIVRAYMNDDIIPSKTDFANYIKDLYDNEKTYSLQISNDGCCVGYSPSRRLLKKKICNELNKKEEYGFFFNLYFKYCMP